MSFNPFSGMTLTAFLAGFALKTVSSPVKGLMPLRALVAGFFYDLYFKQTRHVEYSCAPRF